MSEAFVNMIQTWPRMLLHTAHVYRPACEKDAPSSYEWTGNSWVWQLTLPRQIKMKHGSCQIVVTLFLLFVIRQPATAKWYDRRDSVFIEFCVEDSKDVKVNFDQSKIDFR